MSRNLPLLIVLSAFVLPAVCFGQTGLSQGEHNVVLNGVRLWYKVAGTTVAGQAPLVYLHGGPGYNSYSFEKTIGSKLERHAQVIYLDERGSGRSERPWDRDYSIQAFAEDVEALRKSLLVPQLSLMGHSFGGTIALEYAALYPQHVQKMIIVDGAADVPAAFRLWRHEIQQQYPDAWQSAFNSDAGAQLREAEKGKDQCVITKAEFALEMSVLGKVDSHSFHQWQQFHDQRLRQQQDDLDAESGLQNTGEIGGVYFGPSTEFPCYRFNSVSLLTMPTLVIVGKYDGAVGPEQMRALADQLPHARFDEFNESAHFPYAEEPDKFEKDVASFLAQK